MSCINLFLPTALRLMSTVCFLSVYFQQHISICTPAYHCHRPGNNNVQIKICLDHSASNSNNLVQITTIKKKIKVPCPEFMQFIRKNKCIL